jgi:hypothetical protein
MDRIEDRRTAQSAAETGGPGKGRKSQSLRLEKQIIRTLTGAELKLVGGGANCTVITCHRSDRTQ